MFTKAVEWEMVDEGALKRIRRVKLLPENNERLRYLMKEECQALIQACIPHLKPIVITALNTGMRSDEILSLEWERHVDLTHEVILLNKTKNRDQHGIPINLTLRSTLQSLVRRLDSPYVFTDTTGGDFTMSKEPSTLPVGGLASKISRSMISGIPLAVISSWRVSTSSQSRTCSAIRL
jgi:integrase